MRQIRETAVQVYIRFKRPMRRLVFVTVIVVIVTALGRALLFPSVGRDEIDCARREIRLTIGNPRKCGPVVYVSDDCRAEATSHFDDATKQQEYGTRCRWILRDHDGMFRIPSAPRVYMRPGDILPELKFDRYSFGMLAGPGGKYRCRTAFAPRGVSAAQYLLLVKGITEITSTRVLIFDQAPPDEIQIKDILKLPEVEHMPASEKAELETLFKRAGIPKYFE